MIFWPAFHVLARLDLIFYEYLDLDVTRPSWVDIPLTNLVTTTIGPTGLVTYRSSVLLPTLSNCRL